MEPMICRSGRNEQQAKKARFQLRLGDLEYEQELTVIVLKRDRRLIHRLVGTV